MELFPVSVLQLPGKQRRREGGWKRLSGGTKQRQDSWWLRTHQKLTVPREFLLLEVTPRPETCSRTCRGERLQAAPHPGPQARGSPSPCSEGLFGEESYSLTATQDLCRLRGGGRGGTRLCPSRAPPHSPPSLRTPTLQPAPPPPPQHWLHPRADCVTSHGRSHALGGSRGSNPKPRRRPSCPPPGTTRASLLLSAPQHGPSAVAAGLSVLFSPGRRPGATEGPRCPFSAPGRATSPGCAVGARTQPRRWPPGWGRTAPRSSGGSSLGVVAAQHGSVLRNGRV